MCVCKCVWKCKNRQERRGWPDQGRTEAAFVLLSDWIPGSTVQGLGFRVQGAGCRVQGAGFDSRGRWSRGSIDKAVEDSQTKEELKLRNIENLIIFQGSGCRVQDSGCRVQGAGCRVQPAGSLIPWIDKAVEDGQTKEELKVLLSWYLCVYIYHCVDIHIFMHTHMSMHMCVYVYVSLEMYVYVFVYMYMYKGSLIPWIDKAVEDGQTKEELKVIFIEYVFITLLWIFIHHVTMYTMYTMYIFTFMYAYAYYVYMYIHGIHIYIHQYEYIQSIHEFKEIQSNILRMYSYLCMICMFMCMCICQCKDRHERRGGAVQGASGGEEKIVLD